MEVFDYRIYQGLEQFPLDFNILAVSTFKRIGKGFLYINLGTTPVAFDSFSHSYVLVNSL
jgi:hypothetical protein